MIQSFLNSEKLKDQKKMEGESAACRSFSNTSHSNTSHPKMSKQHSLVSFFTFFYSLNTLSLSLSLSLSSRLVKIVLLNRYSPILFSIALYILLQEYYTTHSHFLFIQSFPFSLFSIQYNNHLKSNWPSVLKYVFLPLPFINMFCK